MRPLESKFTHRLEILNEWTLLSLSYMHLCFSDLLTEEDRYMLGFCYVFASVSNIVIHVFFLLSSTVFKIELCCKRAIYQRKLKREKEGETKEVPGTAKEVELVARKPESLPNLAQNGGDTP